MAKRSFDIGPKRRKASAPASKAKPEKKNTHPRLATRPPKRKLKDRRREEQVRTLSFIALGVVAATGATLYVLWLPALRITEARAAGYGNTEGIEAIAKAELDGTYGGIVPKNSFFFYPERAIRASVLEAYPAISAVSVSRTDMNAIALKATPRVSAFRWCGTPDTLSARLGNCYEADVEGLVFEKAMALSPELASSSVQDESLHVYANLETSSTSDTYPLKARVQGASMLPDVLRFVKAIRGFGVPVASVAIRGDEADLFVEPSTRITYVIGHEREAAKTAEAALKGLNVVDGSLEYIDLRFDGKVYLKRRE
jgi:hypothetical protein